MSQSHVDAALRHSTAPHHPRASAPRLLVERLTTTAQLLALEPEWRALESRLPALPFVAFDWLYPWWQVLRAERLSVKDELFVCTIRDQAGNLRGIAPLMLTRRPGRGPLYLRQLQLFGADPNITEIRTLIAPAEELSELIPVLLDYLRGARAEWDFMQFTGVPASSSSALGLNGSSSDHWVRDVPNYYLTLRPTWDEFKAQLSRNIKESLRKCYNAPKRDGVSLELNVVRDRRNAREAVREFIRLHGARAEREDTIKHPNVFATEGAQEFLTQVCERFADRDRLRIFQLKIGARVVATRIGFVCGDTLYLYFSGYEPEFARYSIMTTTVAEAIQWAIREGFKTVNLSTGNDVSKLRWGPTETVYRDARMVSPSLRGAVTHESFSWASEQIERASAHPRLAALLSRQL